MFLASLSEDKDVRRLVRLWDGCSKSDRRYLGLDSLAMACGIQEERLFGAVVAAAFANGFDAWRLYAAPFDFLRVLEAAAKGARKEGGSRKRERLLVQAGIIKTII